MDSRSRELEEDCWRISILEQIWSFSSCGICLFISPRKLSCQLFNNPINIYKASEVENAFMVLQSGQSKGELALINVLRDRGIDFLAPPYDIS